MKQIILPSIMAKSQKELGKDFKNLKGAAKILHLDIVDGKFAKNKTFQFPFKLSKNFTYNAHLMIKNPENFIKKYSKKIDLFIPHFEEIENPEKYIKWRKSKFQKPKVSESLETAKKSQSKKKVAFALLPETKIKQIKPYIKKINVLLILTVHPGFYGGKFLKSKLRKIKQAKKLNPKVKIIVDGGIHPKTINQAAKAGADFFVSGSYTTKADNPKERIKSLIKAIKN